MMSTMSTCLFLCALLLVARTEAFQFSCPEARQPVRKEAFVLFNYRPFATRAFASVYMPLPYYASTTRTRSSPETPEGPSPKYQIGTSALSRAFQRLSAEPAVIKAVSRLEPKDSHPHQPPNQHKPPLSYQGNPLPVEHKEPLVHWKTGNGFKILDTSDEDDEQASVRLVYWEPGQGKSLVSNITTTSIDEYDGYEDESGAVGALDFRQHQLVQWQQVSGGVTLSPEVPSTAWEEDALLYWQVGDTETHATQDGKDAVAPNLQGRNARTTQQGYTAIAAQNYNAQSNSPTRNYNTNHQYNQHPAYNSHIHYRNVPEYPAQGYFAGQGYNTHGHPPPLPPPPPAYQQGYGIRPPPPGYPMHQPFPPPPQRPIMVNEQGKELTMWDPWAREVFQEQPAFRHAHVPHGNQGQSNGQSGYKQQQPLYRNERERDVVVYWGKRDRNAMSAETKDQTTEEEQSQPQQQPQAEESPAPQSITTKEGNTLSYWKPQSPADTGATSALPSLTEGNLMAWEPNQQVTRARAPEPIKPSQPDDFLPPQQSSTSHLWTPL